MCQMSMEKYGFYVMTMRLTWVRCARLGRDRGLHGQIRALEITEGDPDGHFRVVATGNPGEYNIAVLHLLDREAAPSGYNLTLRASDRGTPMHATYRTVQVRLADLNDNPPVFDREVYDVQVPETAPVNTPITRIKVTDADAGKNAQVSVVAMVTGRRRAPAKGR